MANLNLEDFSEKYRKTAPMECSIYLVSCLDKDTQMQLKKDDFIGKKAMVEMGDLKRQRVGLKVTGKGIVREQSEVFVDGVQIGVTTSGTHCPYLQHPYAMALIQSEYKEIGTNVQVSVRGRMIEAQVCEQPFYKKGM